MECTGQHGKLIVRINSVFPQESVLGLIAMQPGHFLTYRKGDILLLQLRFPIAQQIQVVDIQGPEATGLPLPFERLLLADKILPSGR